MFFLVLNILIVILRHLEAELSILRCLKLIRGVISTYCKKKILSPKFISGRNPVAISADLLTTKIFKKYQEVVWPSDHKDTANTFYSHNFQFIHFKSK
jgi:hypothetical protein